MRGLHALKFSPAYVAISQLRSLITARWLVTQEPRRECDPPPADGHTRSEQSTNECKYNIPCGMWMKPPRNISSPQPRSDILFRGLGTTFAMWRRAPTSPLRKHEVRSASTASAFKICSWGPLTSGFCSRSDESGPAPTHPIQDVVSPLLHSRRAFQDHRSECLRRCQLQ